jgi:hypothetical protein
MAGATLIEFAIVGPFLLVAFFALFEFVQVLTYNARVYSALRTAARFGSSQRGPCEEHTTAIFEAALVENGLPDSAATLHATINTLSIAGSPPYIEFSAVMDPPCRTCRWFVSHANAMPEVTTKLVFPLEGLTECTENW